MADTVLNIEGAPLDVTALVDNLFRTGGDVELATALAYEDIWQVVEDYTLSNGERKHTGHKLILALIKGTYYTPEQIAAGKRLLTAEPHATANKLFRERTEESVWKIKSMPVERIVGGAAPEEMNPNG